jgi:AraC-like DNA-binding protein
VRTREFQPILLENLKIRWPGFTIRRVALNQHMPRVERLGEHVHRFAQMLLYLRGEGQQHLGDRTLPVGRGTVLVIPPGQAHRFEKTRAVRPICLAIDFETTGPPGWRESAILPPGELARIEQQLVLLHETRRRPDPLSIQSAALVVPLLASLAGAVSGSNPRSGGPVTSQVKSVATRHGFSGLSPGLVAASLKRSLDHLNRRLRAESGVTVGGLLDELRLAEATRLLRGSDAEIGTVAAAVGMDDQNYFARWFRRLTGQTPSRWRSAMRE